MIDLRLKLLSRRPASKVAARLFAWLLIVLRRYDDADRRPGDVCKVDEGFFVGFLSRPSAVDGVWDVAFNEWVDICGRIAAMTLEPEPNDLSTEAGAEYSAAG